MHDSVDPAHTLVGDTMTNDMLLLRLLAWRAQTGELRIRTILQSSMHTKLRMLLLVQKKEYSELEAHIHGLAAAKGIMLEEKDPLVQYLSSKLLMLRISLSKSNSTVAAYMIRSCTQGMIDAQTVLNRCPPGTNPLYCIAQRLLDCEKDCIYKLRIYL